MAGLGKKTHQRRVTTNTSFFLLAAGLSTLFACLDFAQAEFRVRGALARPAFQKTSLMVGSKKIVVEVADTDEKRAHGLMFVEKLPADQGMLFVFEDERPRSFWMKNTLIPLSIAYLDKDKVIREIVEMQPAPLGATRPKSYPSKKNSMYALEMNAGWFEKNKIWPGVRIRYTDTIEEKPKL